MFSKMNKVINSPEPLSSTIATQSTNKSGSSCTIQACKSPSSNNCKMM